MLQQTFYKCVCGETLNYFKLITSKSATTFPISEARYRIWIDCQWIEFGIASKNYMIKLLFWSKVGLIYMFSCDCVLWFIIWKFLSWHNFFKSWFTCTTFFRCLSFPMVTLEIATLYETDFNVEANSTIDSANNSAGVFDDRSFV